MVSENNPARKLVRAADDLCRAKAAEKAEAEKKFKAAEAKYLKSKKK